MPDNVKKVVDVQYHVLSPNLAKEIAERVPLPIRYDHKEKAKRTTYGTGRPSLTEEEQLAEADRTGVDILWISIHTHGLFDRGVLPSSSPHCLTLSRTINDYLASICRRYPERFMAFADIPFLHGDAAIEEMRRAITKLGLHGIRLFSNYDGKHLDLPEFRPFFEEANRLRAVVFLHPTYPDPIHPANVKEVFEDRYMYVSVGLPYDTAVTMGRLAYSGILEEFSDLRFILAHAGGIIPFLWWRMDYAYREDLPTSHDHIKAPPTAYFKNCYYDTALTDTESLMLTYKRVGNRLCFATDSPYRREATKETLAAIEAMDIPGEEKAKILGGNALALFQRMKP